MIFFTADTHFQHEKVIAFSKRPFASLAEMNAALVANWRTRVGTDDVVYHLGDVAWRWNAQTRTLLEQLPGTKHLIVGNHDHRHTRNASIWASVQPYLELTIDLPDGGSRLVVLCHYPFLVWRDSHKGAINLHGHTHGVIPGHSQQMDVGVDCTDYAPIALADVLGILQQRKLAEQRARPAFRLEQE